MWPCNFAQRLASWSQLRVHASAADVPTALHAINTWWFQTPWTAYHLHWDDQLTWPDPWQLLSDNMYCGLARGLGIVYTIAMLDRADLQDCDLVDTGSDNLVVVTKKQYILNWHADQVTQIDPGPYQVKHSVSLAHIKQQIK